MSNTVQVMGPKCRCETRCVIPQIDADVRGDLFGTIRGTYAFAVSCASCGKLYKPVEIPVEETNEEDTSQEQ